MPSARFLGEDNWKFCIWFIMSPALCALSFIDFYLYHFTEINCNCEYNDFLSPVSPSSKSVDCRGDLEDFLNYTQIGILCSRKFALGLRKCTNNPCPSSPIPCPQ